jgi:glyoxylase-like metal-dependent hydrolase (beta-lactamase superfamily II)
VGGPVQIYVVLGDPLTLIDTGVKSPASRAALEAAFDALGHGLEEVDLTHHHGDHLGQAQSLRDAGAQLEVWAHEIEAPTIEAWNAERDEAIEATNALFHEYGVPTAVIEKPTAMRRRWLLEDPPLCEATRVDRRLRDGERIAFKEFELEVLHAPGHTAGDTFCCASPRAMTGDHLMGDAAPFTDTYFLDEYFASLRRLRARSIRTLLPAHGGVIDRPARAIDEALLF